jgi:hypothetical protein
MWIGTGDGFTHNCRCCIFLAIRTDALLVGCIQLACYALLDISSVAPRDPAEVPHRVTSEVEAVTRTLWTARYDRLSSVLPAL